MIYIGIILILFILIYYFSIYDLDLFCKSDIINKNFINQEELIKKFNENGYLLIPNSKIICEIEYNEIKKIIKNELSNKNSKFININRSKCINVIIPVEKVKKYIKKICNNLSEFCLGVVPNSYIIDCSCKLTYCGCYAEAWHYDNIHISKNSGRLITIGLFLDDINDDMGPLNIMQSSQNLHGNDEDGIDILNKLQEKHKTKSYTINYYKSVCDPIKELKNRGSNTNDYDIYDLINDDSIEMLCRVLGIKKVKCIGNKGSILILDSYVYQRDCKNNSTKIRPIFYFSLFSEEGKSSKLSKFFENK